MPTELQKYYVSKSSRTYLIELHNCCFFPKSPQKVQIVPSIWKLPFSPLQILIVLAAGHCSACNSFLPLSCLKRSLCRNKQPWTKVKWVKISLGTTVHVRYSVSGSCPSESYGSVSHSRSLGKKPLIKFSK